MKPVLLAVFLMSAAASRAAFPTLQLKPVALEQFSSPTAVANAGDGSGRLFIADQLGKIYVLQDGAILPVPFLDVSAKMVTLLAGYDERGLLGLAFHPDYEVNGAPGKGRFYVFYSAPSPDSPGTAADPVDARSILAEYRVSATNPNVADPTSERVLLSFNKPQFNHNGGQLAFGPVDGMLYVSTGDGGGSNDNDPGHTGGATNKPAGGLGNAQDLTKLLGKVLRIDPLGGNDPGGQYGIPADNPFVLADVAGVDERKEIYAYGLRNPWRFSFDSGGTHRLFLPDVGQDKYEEVNLGVAGGNYGWRRMEAGFDFDATSPAAGPFVAPIAQYAHPSVPSTPLTKVGVAITGGYVYRGSVIPSLQGKYIFGDWSTNFSPPAGTILGLEETSPGVFAMSKLDVVGGNPIGRYIPGFGTDEQGEIYVATKTTLGPAQLASGKPAGQLFKLVSAQPQTVTLPADRDNSIYSEQQSNSNGQGPLFAGLIVNLSGSRRALVHFDLAAIPTGSVVSTAAVTLNVSKVSGATSGNFDFTLHKLNRNWGEGSSSGIGIGAPATPGDATWLESEFGSQSWTTPGGDFGATASATTSVGNLGPYTWNSAGLVADVQSWVNQPANDFGWILRGNESIASAKEFSSREGINGPQLAVTYYPPAARSHREIWHDQYFAVGAYVDPEGDTDADRIPALLEYAWDLNPTVADGPADYMSVAISATNAAVVFRRDPRAVDLEYRLETSSDLTAWAPVVTSTAGATPTGSAYVSEAVDPADTETRRVTASISLNPVTQQKLFVRLAVRRL